MASKRKTTTAIVAGAAAVALLLGGTFAWTSISQTATNETAGIVNVGGRLHDDFDGKNKDVYVENFTDPLNGGQPIYARVKLTEYMEIGQDAGGIDDGDNKNEAVPVVSGTEIGNPDTWTVHVPADSCEVCTTAGTCKIHDHWEWVMGGQTTFMPTFNKDKDSLDADINGTYAGTNANDKIYYDDYVTYVAADGAVVDLTAGTVDGEAVTIPADATDANALTEANKDVTTVTGTAYYDDDTDTDENDHANQIGVKVETETHTAKTTADGTVILMSAWDGTAGNYWVYDTDGWAYWANPIMPGEATGLLLSNIEMTKNPGEKCYYAINVVAQFSTVNDWENFYTDEDSKEYDVSTDAEAVLKAAAANVTTVTVTNNGATTLSTVVDEEAGTTNTTTFTATAAKAGDSTATAAEGEFTWAVYDADLNPVETSTITADGVLTIGANEKNANLIIAATHTESGAVGLSSVAIANTVVTYRLAVSSNNTDDYYEDRGYVNLDSNYTVTLTANDKPLTISEVGEVEIVANYSDSYDALNAFAGSASLQNDGTVLLTVGTQDAELGTSTYAWSYWKIIKLTVKDSEGTEYSRNLLVNNDTLSYSEMVYRHMDGTLASNIQQYAVANNLAINTMYTFEPALYSQSHGNMSQYLDPVWFDDAWTVTAYEYDTETYETGAVATSVTIKDNTIIFAEAGEYVIEAVKGEYETVRSNVAVFD